MSGIKTPTRRGVKTGVFQLFCTFLLNFLKFRIPSRTGMIKSFIAWRKLIRKLATKKSHTINSFPLLSHWVNVHWFKVQSIFDPCTVSLGLFMSRYPFSFFSTRISWSSLYYFLMLPPIRQYSSPISKEPLKNFESPV